jgi:ankyrin repeat protein
LLKSGVSIETRERQGPTVLAIAAEYGRADTVRLLLEQGADIATAGLDGDGAVVEAARMGNVAKLKLLLERGADVRLKNEALLEAAAFSIATIETPAAPPGAGENAEEHQGPEDVPFPSLDRVQTATLLLEQGADIETRRDGDGSTPVKLAASLGNTPLVKALLDKGARIEATNDEGSTALMGSACGCAQATMPDTIDSATLLLSRGANVHAKNKHGSTALMAAAGWGRTSLVQLLLDKGARVNDRDSEGDTALLVASSGAMASAEVIGLLLARGADVNARDNRGQTALMLASTSSTEEVAIVTLLLDRGADVRARDTRGHSAMALAAKNRHTETVRLLKRALAASR